jgi:NTP pyrophosphatase (non-canonical NTP hydrolase)
MLGVLDIDAAMARIQEATNTCTQVELAEVLNVRQSSISDAKRRGNVPAGWLLTLLTTRGINPAWITTGGGERYLVPSPDGVTPAPALAPIVAPAEIHRNSIAHGWWEEDRGWPELLALIHSEVSEALEGYRNRIPEGAHGCISEELADVVIRVFDAAEGLGLDILAAIARKHAYNLTRPYRHGGKVL